MTRAAMVAPDPEIVPARPTLTAVPSAPIMVPNRRLLPIERRQFVIKLLRRQQGVRISEVQRMLGVSASTLRRDFDDVGQLAWVRRVHGGVTLR